MLPQNYAFILKHARKKGEKIPLKISRAKANYQKEFYNLIFHSYSGKIRCKQKQAITITVITVF